MQALTSLTLPKKPGRYADGNGLYLVVEQSGARRWMQRIKIAGRRRDIGLGGFPTVSLAKARDDAAKNRALARIGGDPMAARREARKLRPTFEAIATQVHEARKASWKQGGKHVDQWLNTLKTYAFPVIGKIQIDQVSTAAVLEILKPIWHTKPETAKRVRQRLETVFAYAKTAGLRTGDNPASDLDEALGKQARLIRHHEAMAYAKVPEFVRWLRASSSSEVVRLSFEFLIITFTRSDDVRSARKEEVDFTSRTWTIPADRTKTGRRTGAPHVVPLSDRALAILKRARELWPESSSPLIFPPESGAEIISENTYIEVLRSAGSTATAHGFRSSFKDWASEETRHEHFVVEAAMNHKIPSKVEAAYRRGLLLAKRAALMNDWTYFIESGQSRTTLAASAYQPATTELASAKLQASGGRVESETG